MLQVGESSLYPALQRLLLKGWVKAEWGASENNRRARYYTLTAAGRKQLAVERDDFDRLIMAIHKVLAPYWVDLAMDRRVFAFVAAVCLGSSMLFGLAPALHISKRS